MKFTRQELEKQKSERIGEIRKNNFGSEMKIIEYNNYSDIWIEFQDEYKIKIHTNYSNFKKGNVKNPYDRTVCEIGYIGEGKYKIKENKGITKAYETWSNMIQRCYDPYELNKNKNLAYIDCYVCDEWLCYQNFAEWYYNNYYDIEGKDLRLDKDILVKGNKIYNPNTCIFVPSRINNLFTKSDKARGRCLIGVTYRKKDKVFEVKCSYLDEKGKIQRKYLGRYKSEFQAFTIYKQFKESYIKQIADEYKDLIPTKLYEAMYNYELEIND